MKRIDTKDGLFDDGNHVFGIHGTRVSAEFLNDIQEEIVNVIGARNLDGSKRDQLITAIRNIVKSGGGSSSGSAITQADQDKIDSSYHKLKHFVEDELGIALDAKNDAQLKTAIDSAIAKLQAQLDDIRKKMTNGSTVPLATETTKGISEIATQAEVNAGTDDSRIVTPKKLKVVTSDLDSRATRIRNDVDKNTADLVTHRTDIQQNTTDIVSNTASIATIITTIKKEITTGKLAESFTVPSVLHDKIQLDGEDTAGHYGYAVAMHNDYLAISDPVLQEVVIYHRDKNNKKIFNLEDIHKGKKHGAIFVEDGQVYVKKKDGVHLDVFEYDETQTNLTFKKVNTINLTLSYGNSLAINDNYLIVGNPQSKTALIYKHSGIQWQLVKQLNGGDSFGSSVAVTDKNIIVAEPTNKKIEIFDLNFNKVKTFTGGASYSKLVDGNNYLTTVAEPDNNILKIYENLAEIASKTVKADCVNVGKGIVLATSKTDKKAYLYDFFSKTGWFTTTRTKWDGLPDSANGYTGYNIAGGQYQLVRPVGTTDTYTKYAGGAWVKNGSWGGVLWYDGDKIGVAHYFGKEHTIPAPSSSMDNNRVFISHDGSTIAIGGYHNTSVYIYTLKNNLWQPKGQEIKGGGGFGHYVAFSEDGNICAIAAYYAFYAEVYEFKNNSWQQKGQRVTGSRNFGTCIAASKDGLVFCVTAYNGSYGEVYEFKGSTWQRKGQRLTSSDRFGSFCDISDDGSVVVIASEDAPFIQVYEFDGVLWKLRGLRITTQNTGYEGLCSLSGDGLVVAHGGDRKKIVAIYKFQNSAWKLKGQLLNFNNHTAYLQLSKDGNTIYIVANNTLHVYTYNSSKNTWVKTNFMVANINTGDKAPASLSSVFFIAINSNKSIEVYSISKQLYLETTDGKHYYNNKEVKDSAKFNSIMETVAPLSALPNPIVQTNRNIKVTATDLQEQPNKTGNYVSLLGTGTATTPVDITKLDTNFTIDNNYGDACAITTDKILITNKTDSKLAVYDHLGTKEKEIQLEAGVGSVIDATENEAIVGSETANTVDVINLKI